MRFSLLVREVSRRVAGALRGRVGCPEEGDGFPPAAENAGDVAYRYRFVPGRGFAYVSPAATAVTGYTPEEHYADPGLGQKLVHPEDRHLLEDPARDLEKPLVLRWRRKDGALIWAERRDKPVYGPGGELVALEGIARDVTERRRAEEALRRSEARARGTLDSLSAQVAILDSTGTIVAVNRAWTGFARDVAGAEGRGVGVDYLRVCDAAAATGSEEAARFARGVRDVISGRQTYFELEYPCPTPAGLRWFVGRITPFSGAPGAVVAHEDVTERRRAEEALRESEERLRLALEAASLGSWYQDLKTGEFVARPDTAAMHGLPPDVPLRWEDALAAVDPRDRDRVAFLVERAVSTGGSFEAEYRVTGPDGTVRWMASRARVHGDGRLIGVVQEVTERKNNEEERERSLARERSSREQAQRARKREGEQAALLDAILKTAPVGLAFLDTDLRFVRINDSLATMNGLPVREHLGRTLAEVRPSLEEAVGGLLRRVLETKEPVTDVEVSGRSTVDPGRVLHSLASYYPVRDGGGRMLGIGCVVVDITGRKRAQAALRESEARFRLLAENTSDLVCLHAPDGRYLYLSPSCRRLLGYEPEELLGTDPYDLFHPDDADRIREESHEKVLKGGVPVSVTFRIRKKSGEYLWMETLTQPILDEGGAVVRFQTSSRDVSERRRAQEALAAAARQKTEFLAEVSHELRTPLTVIRGNAEIGLEVAHDRGHAEILREIVREASTMTRMVEDLLFLARSESSAPPFRMEPVAVGTLMASLARRARTLAAEHDATLEVAPAPAGRVRVDPARIEQAVLALVDNAGKYGPPGGRITLAPAAPDGNLRIEVRDEGPGIPEDELPLVFERFYRGDGTGEPGSGLGLSIVGTILKAHGGRVEAESEPGRGTRVSLILPLLPASG